MVKYLYNSSRPFKSDSMTDELVTNSRNNFCFSVRLNFRVVDNRLVPYIVNVIQQCKQTIFWLFFPLAMYQE